MIKINRLKLLLNRNHDSLEMGIDTALLQSTYLFLLALLEVFVRLPLRSGNVLFVVHHGHPGPGGDCIKKGLPGKSILRYKRIGLREILFTN